MRRGRFEYEFTCPTIDKALDEIDTVVDYAIDDILKHDYENAEVQFRLDLRQDILDAIYVAVEKVRTSNQDIREAAEKQITELFDELSSAAEEIDDLNKRVEQLENEVSDWKIEYEETNRAYNRVLEENNELADKLYEYEQ